MSSDLSEQRTSATLVSEAPPCAASPEELGNQCRENGTQVQSSSSSAVQAVATEHESNGLTADSCEDRLPQPVSAVGQLVNSEASSAPSNELESEEATSSSKVIESEGLPQRGEDTAKPDSKTADDDDSDDSEDDEEQMKQEEEDDAHVDPEKAQELRLQGNEFFKANKLHDAREAYSEALYLTPVADKKSRSVLHANRAACLQKLSRWDDVIDDCKHAVDLDPTYAKAYLRRSTAYEALEKWHDANEDLKKAIELDPALKSKEYKRQAVLEHRAQEQFEKDKEEMMEKLKGFGNMVLGKFGMSTDNFKCEKDPDSGSYSLKFQQ